MMKNNLYTSASSHPRLGMTVMILWVIAQLFFFQSLTANLAAIEIPRGYVPESVRNRDHGPADRMGPKTEAWFAPHSISESIIASVAPVDNSRLIPEAPLDEKLFSRLLVHASSFSTELPQPVTASSWIPEPPPQPSENQSDVLEFLFEPVLPEPAIESPQSNETDASTSNPPEKVEDPEDRFTSIVIQAAQRFSVDPAIIKAIIKAESGYNPKAVSNRGAKGLMQLMPNTAKSLGVEDIFCPEQNILAGVRYFKQLLNEFKGSTKLALAAYNSGSRKVKQYKGIPPFKTTRLYIKKVFKYHQEYSRQFAEKGLNSIEPQAFSSFTSF